MISRIHVNRHKIDANRKSGATDPVLTVKRGGRNYYGKTVTILGPSQVVYRPEKPLGCGAKVWIETEAEVVIE
jgi:hypothetical protein